MYMKNKVRILVIEDDSFFRDLLCTHLVNAGDTVQIAEDAVGVAKRLIILNRSN